MPEVMKPGKSQSKKPRLGRGLGSLISTDASAFEEAPASKAKEAAVPQKVRAPEKKLAPQKSSPPLANARESKAVPVTKQPEQPIQNNQSAQVNTLEASSLPTQKVPTQNAKVVSVQEKIKDTHRIWDVSVAKVFPNKRQPRKDFDKEPLQDLARSIKEQGILQPITVRKQGEGFEIIAGERRWRAAQQAGLHEVPVIIKDVDNQKVMELALIENIQRENLNPVEEAIAYQQLIEDYDLSQAEVAKKVGKERATVANTLRVLTLPKEVKRSLRSREISVGHAKVLLSLSEPEKQVQFLKKIVADKLSVRALEKEIRKKKMDAQALGEVDVSERLSQALATDLQGLLGTKVKIHYKSGKGKIEISYYSDDELTAFCDKIKESWQPTT